PVQFTEAVIYVKFASF
ncbi:unnamed protein product, partial [Allacma fusca]